MEMRVKEGRGSIEWKPASKDKITAIEQSTDSIIAYIHFSPSILDLIIITG